MRYEKVTIWFFLSISKLFRWSFTAAPAAALIPVAVARPPLATIISLFTPFPQLIPVGPRLAAEFQQRHGLDFNPRPWLLAAHHVLTKAQLLVAMAVITASAHQRNEVAVAHTLQKNMAAFLCIPIAPQNYALWPRHVDFFGILPPAAKQTMKPRLIRGGALNVDDA